MVDDLSKFVWLETTESCTAAPTAKHLLRWCKTLGVPEVRVSDILVMMDDLSNFVWLEPTELCTAASTAKHLLRWCKTSGVPDVWVSGTASHFKSRVMKTLEGALRVGHRFAVSSSPWSNGTYERMMREVVHTLKTILQEERRDIRRSVDVIPMVQWALNTGLSREIRNHTVPRHVWAGANDKFLNLGFADRRRLESGCTRWRGLTEEGGERCRGTATTA